MLKGAPGPHQLRGTPGGDVLPRGALATTEGCPLAPMGAPRSNTNPARHPSGVRPRGAPATTGGCPPLLKGATRPTPTPGHPSRGGVRPRGAPATTGRCPLAPMGAPRSNTNPARHPSGVRPRGAPATTGGCPLAPRVVYGLSHQNPAWGNPSGVRPRGALYSYRRGARARLSHKPRGKPLRGEQICSNLTKFALICSKPNLT